MAHQFDELDELAQRLKPRLEAIVRLENRRLGIPNRNRRSANGGGGWRLSRNQERAARQAYTPPPNGRHTDADSLGEEAPKVGG